MIVTGSCLRSSKEAVDQAREYRMYIPWTSKSKRD